VTIESFAKSTFSVLPVPIQSYVLRRTGRFPGWADGQAPRAPACPDGMTVGPPDFVGVGFSKAGTSWWFSLIAAHPDVHPPARKELLFFNRPFFQRLRDEGCTDDELRAYHQWFPRPAGQITGEWTPSYVFWYQLAPLLRRAAPGAKILVLVRDPVERYQSDISRRMPRQRLETSRFRSLANGMYTARLEPWIRVFPSPDLLVLQYEACVNEPEEQLAATYRFLGLDDTFRPPGLHRPVNQTKVKRSLAPGFQGMLTELYEPDVVMLAERYPQIDLRLWPNFSRLASRQDGSG
jgi:hypothetical protein